MLTNNLPILDNKVLLGLLGGNKSQLRAFQLEFLLEASVTVEKISLAKNKVDFDSIKNMAHYLCSSATAVGASRFANTLMQLEESAEQREKSRCDECFLELLQQLKLVRKEIEDAE